MKAIIQNKTFDLERSLYNLTDTKLINVVFKGINDGESVLKETRNCEIIKCDFALRYPLWHARSFKLMDSSLNELTRAPIWYCTNGLINKTTINSIKALRECKNIKINDCSINSLEFGWKCHNITINNTSLISEYPFFEATRLNIYNLNMKGKYSFQYVKNATINDSFFDTKDAFWHCNNIKVVNSYIKGEYLGWFSKNLTLINCKIEGTQPFCYCDNLTLIDCEMINTDLSFEYSSVNATINGNIISIKNPKSGTIICDSVNEIIRDHTTINCDGKIIIRNN